MKSTGPLGKTTDFLFPAKPTKLETVGHFMIEAAMGNLDKDTHKMMGPEFVNAEDNKF